MCEVQIPQPGCPSEAAHMLHVGLKPQVRCSEQDQGKDEAQIITRKDCVAEITEGDDKDPGRHHESRMQKYLRKRVGLMNDRRADDDHEHSKQAQPNALYQCNCQTCEEPSPAADRKAQAE